MYICIDAQNNSSQDSLALALPSGQFTAAAQRKATHSRHDGLSEECNCCKYWTNVG